MVGPWRGCLGAHAPLLIPMVLAGLARATLPTEVAPAACNEFQEDHDPPQCPSGCCVNSQCAQGKDCAAMIELFGGMVGGMIMFCCCCSCVAVLGLAYWCFARNYWQSARNFFPARAPPQPGAYYQMDTFNQQGPCMPSMPMTHMNHPMFVQQRGPMQMMQQPVIAQLAAREPPPAAAVQPNLSQPMLGQEEPAQPAQPAQPHPSPP